MSCEKENLDSAFVESANASVKALNTVKITSTGMNFFAPDEIPSGWNTFSYQNKGHVPHFFLLVKVPEGKTLEEYRNEITVPFNEWLWELVENPDAVPNLADWFWTEAINYGGSGIVDPGKTAVTSINLPAGNYIMECYVKMPGDAFDMPGGVFHSYPVNGMVKRITVTDEKTKEKEPKSDITIDVTSEGFVLDKEINRPGKYTFKVKFDAGASLPDVHLVKLNGASEEDLTELNSWMHWMNNLGEANEGMMTPAPTGFTFLGGAQELEYGGNTYFQAVLKPGKYVLIAEWPDSMASGYYHEFEVGEEK
jgi:hypothetical protein